MRTRIVTTVAACLLVTACSGDGPAEAPLGAEDGAADGAAGPVVTIADFDFGDIPTVPAGTPFTVENTDAASHTLTADDGTFDTGSIGSGDRATLTVDAAGDYVVRCSIHPSMTGTLTVSG